MSGLEEIFFKGFGYDKYLGIASKDEIEKLDILNKTIIISDELKEKIRTIDKKVRTIISVETWCPYARVFLTTLRKINEINQIFDLSLITYGRGIGEFCGYLKINEDDFVVPTAAFIDDEGKLKKIFNGYPEKFHNDDTLDNIDGTRNYLRGHNANDIIEDVLKVF